MAMFDIIEWTDNSGTQLVKRVPENGSGEFRLGSQLIVRETQAAVFFKDGQGRDTFSAGRHTLSTANLPILTKILSIPFGGKSPFRAEVIFVSLQTFLDQKWGTREPIPFRDTDLGIVRLRAFGNYTMRVTEPQLFVTSVVGSRGVFTTEAIGDYLRSVIVSRFNDVLGENMKSVLDLAMIYDELGIALKTRIQTDFAKFGVEVQDFFIQAITPPEEVQKAMDKRASMGAVGDLNKFTQFQAANAMEAAANNPGGGAGAAMGLGAGAGLGMMQAQMMANAMAANQQPAAQARPAPAAATVACPSCQAQNAAGAKFCSSCGKAIPGAAACAKCNTTNAPGAKFCSNCGSGLGAAACPKCSQPVAAGAKFCGNCGNATA